MISNLLIIGASTPTIVRIIDDINNKMGRTLNILGFIDNDKSKHGSKFMGYVVYGGQEEICNFNKNDVKLINTIAGSISARIETSEYMINKGYLFTNIIHPSINLNYVDIGVGVYLQEYALIQVNAKIGNHVIISSNSTVAHDTVIGDYTFIGPSVYVCGRVKIGKNCFIGVGAKILPNILIGDNSIVAAGSLVVKNIPANCKVKGVPAMEY